MKRALSSMSPTYLLLIAIACARPYMGPDSLPGDTDEGMAAYYSDSLHGNKTASGERYDRDLMTAAHRTLPFGTMVRVTSLVNRRFVEVRINDRGPYSHKDRIIDLSRKAAERLDMIGSGVVPVRIEIISIPERGKVGKPSK